MDHEIANFTAAFPILEKLTFLNHAAVAPISAAAGLALRQYASQAESAAYCGARWYGRIEAIRRAAAVLIGARGAHEIAFVPNTSAGLGLVARGLDWVAGDNVVITAVEYPANRYPWQDLERLGVSLIEVPQLPDGRIDTEDVADAITDRTRIVSISHVQYGSGHRVDLRPISAMVHRAGGYLCVDAIQSVGAMPVDVQALGIDFLAADGHKWMLGPEGCGIFYCHEELIEMLHPAVVGWMNMVNATDYGNYRFELRRDARRFEPGSFNVPGILALGASIDLLLEAGLDNVWSRIEALTALLSAALKDKGYRVFSPRSDPSERSGIVVFEPPPPEVRPTPPLEQIAADLQRQNIIIAVREGRLRASPHYYNTQAQIQSLVDALP
jgi:cysteine desulfurase/selenocysteine lyase